MSLRGSEFTSAEASLVFFLPFFRRFYILFDIFRLGKRVDQLFKLTDLLPSLCLKVLGGLRAGLLSHLLFFWFPNRAKLL
jgi:hypothetical protein